MGVVVSYFHRNEQSNEPDSVTGLTPREKYLVTTTWALAKKDMNNVGMEMFLIFFQDHPEYIKYFPFRDVPIEEFRTNPLVKTHASSVAYALACIVDNLDDNDVLVSLLGKSGSDHGRRPIPEHAYWDLKTAVLKLLGKTFGVRITQEGLQAWDRTLTIAFKVIIEAFKKQREIGDNAH